MIVCLLLWLSTSPEYHALCCATGHKLETNVCRMLTAPSRNSGNAFLYLHQGAPKLIRTHLRSKHRWSTQTQVLISLTSLASVPFLSPSLGSVLTLLCLRYYCHHSISMSHGSFLLLPIQLTHSTTPNSEIFRYHSAQSLTISFVFFLGMVKRNKTKQKNSSVNYPNLLVFLTLIWKRITSSGHPAWGLDRYFCLFFT